MPDDTRERIEFRCAECGKTVSAPASYAGKSGKCPGCGTKVKIPAAQPSPAKAKPQPPPQPAGQPKTKPHSPPAAQPKPKPQPQPQAPAQPQAQAEPKTRPEPEAAAPKHNEFLAQVERVLASDTLRPVPHAVLLLRTCQFAQTFRPDVFTKYWPRLRDANSRLPADMREDFEGLRSGVEPPATSVGKFAREITARIADALTTADSAPQKARELLGECEEAIRKRWWPFGKQPAWTALVQAMAPLDREGALTLIGRVPRPVQKNVLSRMNDTEPLTAAQWDLAHQHGGMFGGIMPVLHELLDREDVVLHLSEKLALAVGDSLRGDVHATSFDGSGSRELENKRDTAMGRYLRLVESVRADALDMACILMQNLYFDCS